MSPPGIIRTEHITLAMEVSPLSLVSRQRFAPAPQSSRTCKESLHRALPLRSRIAEKPRRFERACLQCLRENSSRTKNPGASRPGSPHSKSKLPCRDRIPAARGSFHPHSARNPGTLAGQVHPADGMRVLVSGRRGTPRLGAIEGAKETIVKKVSSMATARSKLPMSGSHLRCGGIFPRS